MLVSSAARELQLVLPIQIPVARSPTAKFFQHCFSADPLELVDLERDTRSGNVFECNAESLLRLLINESCSLAVDLANNSIYPVGRKLLPGVVLTGELLDVPMAMLLASPPGAAYLWRRTATKLARQGAERNLRHTSVSCQPTVASAMPSGFLLFPIDVAACSIPKLPSSPSDSCRLSQGSLVVDGD